MDEHGLNRHVPGSLQIRSGGLNGVLVAVERQRGIRRSEVPNHMMKFDTWAKELGATGFNKVRPIWLLAHLGRQQAGRHGKEYG